MDVSCGGGGGAAPPRGGGDPNSENSLKRSIVLRLTVQMLRGLIRAELHPCGMATPDEKISPFPPPPWRPPPSCGVLSPAQPLFPLSLPSQLPPPLPPFSFPAVAPALPEVDRTPDLPRTRLTCQSEEIVELVVGRCSSLSSGGATAAANRAFRRLDFGKKFEDLWGFY